MNFTRLEDLFVSEGSPQPTGSNRPFLMDDPDNVWFVQDGVLDLFIVPALAEGLGSRRHFLRAHRGQIVFGVAGGDGRQEVSFQGVGGNNSNVYRLHRRRLQEVTSAESSAILISEALDVWIRSVYDQVASGVLPAGCLQLKLDETYELASGDTARSVDCVIWVSHVKGHSRLAGLEKLEVSTDSGIIPLTPTVWLEATEQVVVTTTDTGTQLRSGVLWPALPEFELRIRRWAALAVQEAVVQDSELLKARGQSALSTLQDAIGQLAQPLVLRANKTSTSHKPAYPLAGAFQLVSQALGVTTHTPVASASKDGRKDGLERLARSARLRVRRVMLTGEWWRQDNGPILAHLKEDNQPVALLSPSADAYVLADPLEGTCKAVTADLAESLHPIAYTFYRPFPETPLTAWNVLRFALHGTRDDQRMILLLSVVTGLLGIAMPLATGLVIDTVIPSDYLSQLWFVTLGLLVISFASIIFEVTRGIALLRVEAKSDVVVQGAVWDRLLSLPATFFRSYTAGDLAMRANGINAIQQIMSGAVITSVLGGIFSIFNFALLFYYSNRLAAVASLLVVLNIGITLLASWQGLRLQRPLCELEGKISGQVLQFITGISKLRVACAETQAFAVWAKGFSRQKAIDLRMQTLGNGMTVLNHSYPVVTSMCLFGVVAFWSEPGLTTGKFLAFSAAFMSFLYAGLSASEALISVLHTIPIYERARPILQALPETGELRADPGELRGSIEFNHVSFRYKSDGPKVLNDISLQIAPGEFVAIVGPSGSGKSTLLRLLLGFEQPESGAIRYDGLDLAGLDVQAVRRQIGVVLQNGKLMPGDIFENIIGSGSFTLDDAWEAARKAGLEDDIQQMPMGMHTVLGETAGTLSGGQRQRLMIARAIVAKPRILLFDEATSALDNRTQTMVTQNLKQMQATRLVIAHRLSTIMNADRILVIKQGRVVQVGTYEALVKQEGAFAELAQRQLT
jgi:NHLM bacteriocin system ABC transporter ATP-binding protein